MEPKGAMYMMVGIDMCRYPEFATEFQFVERLVSEQSVFCLPGKCFEYADYFRIVLTVPDEQLLVALDRILEFCQTHYVPDHERVVNSFHSKTDIILGSVGSSSEEEAEIERVAATKLNQLPSSYRPTSQAAKS